MSEFNSVSVDRADLVETLQSWYLARLKSNFLLDSSNKSLTPGTLVGLEADAIRASVADRHAEELQDEQLNKLELEGRLSTPKILSAVFTLILIQFSCFKFSLSLTTNALVTIIAVLFIACLIYRSRSAVDKRALTIILSSVRSTDKGSSTFQYIESTKAKLVNLQERLALLTEFSYQIVLGFDRNGSIFWENQTFSSLLKIDKIIIRGNRIQDLLCETSQGIFAKILADPKCLRSLIPLKLSFRSDSNNSSVTINSNIEYSSVHDCFFLAGDDVSNKILLEKVKNDFAETLAHDFRAPLAVIKLTLDLIAMEHCDDLEKEDIDRIERANENISFLTELCTKLITLHKSEAGELNLESKLYPALTIFEDSIAILSSQIAEKSLTIQHDIHEEYVIRCDRTLLQQVLVNLLSNAIKFSPQNGSIKISTSEHKESLEFQIADEGPGIPDDQRTLIFDKYKQVEKGRSQEKKGFGLGLSIAKSLAEIQGVKIRLAKCAKGATFAVEVPKALEGELD